MKTKYDFNKNDLFTYKGDFEDFEERSDRYFAQLAVQTNGLAVRDNSIKELIQTGARLHNTDFFAEEYLK